MNQIRIYKRTAQAKLQTATPLVEQVSRSSPTKPNENDSPLHLVFRKEEPRFGLVQNIMTNRNV